jgi:hypothetical protein
LNAHKRDSKNARRSGRAKVLMTMHRINHKDSKRKSIRENPQCSSSARRDAVAAVSRRGPHTPEAKERLRAALVKYWANPTARAHQSELTKRRMALPGVRERIAERTKAALADPNTRARQRAGLLRAMAAPEVRSRISAGTQEAMRDPAVRARIRSGMAEAALLKAELRPLRALWSTLSEAARRKFVAEIASLVAERSS